MFSEIHITIPQPWSAYVLKTFIGVCDLRFIFVSKQVNQP